jgi:hypothetical protein
MIRIITLISMLLIGNIVAFAQNVGSSPEYISP